MIPLKQNPALVEKAVSKNAEKLQPRSIESIGYVTGKGWVVPKKDEANIWKVVEEIHLPAFIKAGEAYKAAAANA